MNLLEFSTVASAGLEIKLASMARHLKLSAIRNVMQILLKLKHVEVAGEIMSMLYSQNAHTLSIPQLLSMLPMIFN
jgi:hypothetical protein